jgi:hypothetical protein
MKPTERIIVSTLLRPVRFVGRNRDVVYRAAIVWGVIFTLDAAAKKLKDTN